MFGADDRKRTWCTGSRLRRLNLPSLMVVGMLLGTAVYLYLSETQKTERKYARRYIGQVSELSEPKNDANVYLNKVSPNDTDKDALDTQLADALRSKVRILCLVLTMERFMESRAKAVKYTWAKRCDKYFFVLNTWRRSQNIINTNVTETRFNIVYKVRQAITHVFSHHIDSFDWLLKADDDTYVIMENLRYLLSKYNPHDPGHLGYHYNKFIRNGFMSGGAGYVISNSAVRMLVKDGFDSHLCDVKPRSYNLENGEDLEVGHCLERLGVPVLSSLDSRLRETFHPNSVENHLFGDLPVYVYDMAMNTPKTGPECCSRFTVSYHYVNPKIMVVMEHLLYKTSVYGRNTLPDGETVFSIGTVKPKPQQ